MNPRRGKRPGAPTEEMKGITLFTKRISALLGAAGLAAAGFAAVAAAPAASAAPAVPHITGTTIATKNAAGFEASGRDFRYISSTITIPDDSFPHGRRPLTRPAPSGTPSAVWAITPAGVEFAYEHGATS